MKLPKIGADLKFLVGDKELGVQPGDRFKIRNITDDNEIVMYGDIRNKGDTDRVDLETQVYFDMLKNGDIEVEESMNAAQKLINAARTHEEKTKLIAKYEIEDIGVEHPDSFQGKGVSHTKWDDVAVGIGYSAHEAGEDALEQLAQMGYDMAKPPKLTGLSKETPKELDSDGRENGSYYYVAIYVKAGKEIGEAAPGALEKKARKFAKTLSKLADQSMDDLRQIGEVLNEAIIDFADREELGDTGEAELHSSVCGIIRNALRDEFSLGQDIESVLVHYGPSAPDDDEEDEEETDEVLENPAIDDIEMEKSPDGSDAPNATVDKLLGMIKTKVDRKPTADRLSHYQKLSDLAIEAAVAGPKALPTIIANLKSFYKEL